ncbi:hypothetical protein DPX16_4834 [Anabarilius grahami]|uniref:Uncharacterized protein n=1 Tax=Anabarilius grahami TaxID=495550 RepID=A0A3N0ZAA6_ANAGA|nr:hypothetical protein DPX16_4834 [Anabarilius grahami]
MDGVERKRTEAQRSIMKDNELKRDSSIPERVTLKKEIGLLSACAIIIELSPFGMVKGIFQGSVDDLHVFLQSVVLVVGILGDLGTGSFLQLNPCCSIQCVCTTVVALRTFSP